MGFGFIMEAWQRLKQNNAQRRYQSTFDRSNPDFLGHHLDEMPPWNKKLKFKKLSKEELSEYIRNLDIKARRASRKQGFILALSFIITAIIVVYVLNLQVDTKNEYREKLAAEKAKEVEYFIQDAQRYERLGQFYNARFQYQWAFDLDTSNQVAKEGLERLKKIGY